MDLLERDGIEVKRGKCICPFHSETTPSFSLSNGGRGGHCFGCNWKGDAISYWKDSRGFQDRIEAARDLLETHGDSPIVHQKSQQVPDFCDMSLHRQIANHASVQFKDGIKDTGSVIRRLSKERGISRQALLALHSDGSLGALDGKPCYIYPEGIKIRYELESSRSSRWQIGSAGEHPWRSHLLSTPSIETVWITEGETDAMRAMSVRQEGNKELFIAAPGCSWNPSEEMLYKVGAHRKVVMCFDNDDPGRAFAERIGNGLAMVSGCEVSEFPWFLAGNVKDLCGFTEDNELRYYLEQC